MAEVEKMRNAGIDVKCFPSAHTVYFENKYGANSTTAPSACLPKADPFTINEMGT